MKHFALFAVAALGCAASAHASPPDVSASLAATRTSAARRDPRRGTCGGDLGTQCAASTDSPARHQGVARRRGQGAHQGPGGRRQLYLLDLWRRCSGPIHSRPRRRPGADAIEQSPRQLGCAQHRFSRCHRARRRRRSLVRCSWPQRHLHLARDARGSLSLSLRRGARGHAPRQWHVWPDPGRTQEGMPKVDKEFFIVQGEFYTSGAYGEPGEQQFDMGKAVREQPEYVVFNGRVGALMGENALRMAAGESVRLYLGNAGPALMSSFHIVGEIFDDVYRRGRHEGESAQCADHGRSGRWISDGGPRDGRARHLPVRGPLHVPCFQQGRHGRHASRRSAAARKSSQAGRPRGFSIPERACNVLPRCTRHPRITSEKHI